MSEKKCNEKRNTEPCDAAIETLRSSTERMLNGGTIITCSHCGRRWRGEYGQHNHFDWRLM